MATVLRTLAVQVKLNTAAFRKDVDAVDRKFAQSSRRIRGNARGMTRSFSSLGLAFSAVMGGRILKDAADTMIDLRNKMQSVTDTTGQYAFAMNEVKRIARQSRAELGAVGTLYQRLIVSTKSLGFTMADVSAATQVVTDTFVLSGTTAQEAANSARQFAQGMASGAIKGDEFRSISENNVVLMNILAKGMKMTVGQLKDFAANNGLTARVVLPILQKALVETREKVDDMAWSLGQASMMVKNEFVEVIDRLNQKYKIFRKVAEAILNLSHNLWILVGVITALVVPALTGFLIKGLTMGIGYFAAYTAKVYGLIKAVTILTVRMALLALPFLAAAAATLVGVSALLAFLDHIGVFKTEAGKNFSDLWDSVGDYLTAKIVVWTSKLKLFGLNVMRWFAEKMGNADAVGGYDIRIKKVFDELTAGQARVEDTFNAMSDAAATSFGDIKAIVDDVFGDVFNDAGMQGMIDAFIEKVTALPAHIQETFPQLKEFMDVLSGRWNPDENEDPEQATDPNSWAAMWAAAVQKIQDAFSGLKEKMADVFTDAIMGAATLREGIMAIATEITRTLLKALIQWGIEWVVNMVKGATTAATTLATTTAATVASMAAITAAATPAAVMTSLASFGANAAPASAGIMSTMAVGQSASLMGVAHDGLNYVPDDGTYLLQKGERVVDSRLNGDLKSFLAAPNMGGGGGNVTLEVNGVSDPDVVIEALASRRGELETILRQVTSRNLGKQV